MSHSDAVQQERNRRFTKNPTTDAMRDAQLQNVISQKAYDGEFATFPSRILEGEISSIMWTKDLQVEMITAIDGKIHLETAEPEPKRYVSLVAYPFVGFFAFWGATRLIGLAFGWVGAGFASS